MLKRIALHGPIGSGKTSLARELQYRHQYMWINYTDFLKQLVCNAVSEYGKTVVSVEDMNGNKEQWRPLINAYGDAINFANRADFIDEALDPWLRRTWPVNAVFDNIRSTFQAQALRERGFKVVKLLAPIDVLHARRPATEDSRSHWIETPLPDSMIDYYVDATLPLDEVVRRVHESL